VLLVKPKNGAFLELRCIGKKEVTVPLTFGEWGAIIEAATALPPSHHERWRVNAPDEARQPAHDEG